MGVNISQGWRALSGIEHEQDPEPVDSAFPETGAGHDRSRVRSVGGDRATDGAEPGEADTPRTGACTGRGGM